MVSEAGVVVCGGGGDTVTFPNAFGPLPSFRSLIPPDPSRAPSAFSGLPVFVTFLETQDIGEGWGRGLRFP